MPRHPAPNSILGIRFSSFSHRGTPITLTTLALGLTLLSGTLGAAPAALPAAATRQVDFAKDIQPLFEKYCYKCHAAEKQKGELRLDARSAAFKGGENGPILKKGQGAESPIVQAVAGLDPDKVMPPKGDRLSAEDVGLLRAWIDQGAVWPDGVDKVHIVDGADHWAFKAPVRPTLPETRNKPWARNAIDHFILAKLEKENLAPAPEADKVTLIRRLHLDLIGLPPTPAAIDRFLADTRPQAYEHLVEQLLASPHYGERWGRHWLDAARYADSNGYEKDLARPIWPYRDWVIKAVAEDMPFDQFTVEQFAGDLLPNSTVQQRVATGLLRNSMLNEEGGIDPETFRLEGLVDRMDMIGKTYLGLPLNCGQCHNLKYDPITQREYYQLFAMLNNDDEPELEVPSSEQLQKRASILETLARLERDAQAADPAWTTRMTAWEHQAAPLKGTWEILEPTEWHGTIGAKLDKLDDASLLAGGSNPWESDYTVTIKTKLTGITGFRLEALTHPNLRRNGPGRSKDGSFVLSDFSLVIAPADKPTETNSVPLVDASADYQHPDFPVSRAIDGVLTNGWGIQAGPGRINQDRKAVFRTKTAIGFEQGTLLTFTLQHRNGGERTIGRLRLSATTSPNPVADPVPASVRAILSKAPAERTPADPQAIFRFFRTTDPAFAALNTAANEQWDQWPYGPTTLALQQRALPRKTFVFRRGSFESPTEQVQPGVPSVLHKLPGDAPKNRLGLARWIVDRTNPLTSRVLVNRVWQTYFGTGIISTPEDFGSRGDVPSHPELLDWLATEFVEPTVYTTRPPASGAATPQPWSLKHLHRLIVTSATYRQSSRVDPSLLTRDPGNRFLARFPRLRVESELIRDIALAASGLLSPKIGGPSVFPPIPDGVLSLGYGAPMKWETSTGEDRYRRGMYTFWKRNVPYPAQLAFDAPSGEKSCVRRIRSNTPLQALTSLNDQTYHETAQALGLRIYNECKGDDTARIQYGFRLCVGRNPDATETAALQKLLAAQAFEDNTAAAVLVASPDPKSPPKNVNLHKVAAWTMVARVLLNMDETVTRE